MGLRTHHLFEVLKAARDIVLAYAREYADAVMAVARDKRVPLLSRPEMIEAARQSPVPARFKTNVFCVSDESLLTADGVQTYACAWSPLLSLGQVERLSPPPRLEALDPALLKPTEGGGKRVKKAENQRLKKLAQARFARLEKYDREHEARRNQAKFAWCYGGIEGTPVHGNAPSPNLWRDDLASPYTMDVPPHVNAKGSSAASWLKCGGFAYSDEAWDRVNPNIFKLVKGKKQGKAKDLIQGLASKACRELFPDACPRKSRIEFAALPERDRWLERALACPGRPLLEAHHYADAARAHREMLGLAAEMRREVATYAREIANGYLARYGFSLDEWLAAVGNGRTTVVAAARTIGGDLQREAQAIRRMRARR